MTLPSRAKRRTGRAVPARLPSRPLPWCLAVAIGLTGCTEGGGNTRRAGEQKAEPAAAVIDVGGAPATFYAVWDHGTEIVEVETATGRVRRTVLDVGPYREPPTDGGPDANTYIDAIDLAPDGRTLWYSPGRLFANGSVYRLTLPDGRQEQVAAGHGPSVSPDGRRLAYIDDTAIRIRDLLSGDERMLSDAVGLEGHDTSWSADSTKVAFLTGGADSFSVASIDTATGAPTAPRSAAGLGGTYTPYSPKYRPSDGLLAVICCGEIPDPRPGQAPPPALVLHDPVRGAQRERIELPFVAGTHDYDRSGTHHLLTAAPGGEVHLDRGGTLVRIPEITGVSELAW